MVTLAAEPSTPWSSAPSLSSLKATVKVRVGKPDTCEVGLRGPNVKQLLHLQLQIYKHICILHVQTYINMYVFVVSMVLFVLHKYYGLYIHHMQSDTT